MKNVQNFLPKIPGKVPPHDVQYEAMVLGSILLQPEWLVKIVDELAYDDFYLRRHQDIYRAMCALYERRVSPDIVSVQAYLTDHHKLKMTGGPVFLQELCDVIPNERQLLFWTDEIRRFSRCRKLAVVLHGMALDCQRAGDDIDEKINSAEQRVFELSQGRRSGLRPLGEYAVAESQRIYELGAKVQEYGAWLTGVPSGYRRLDSLTTGFQPGNLVILAARPSMGKTAFALNIAINAARQGYGVGMFSLEMSKDALAMRYLSMMGKVDMHKIRTGQGLTDDEWRSLTRAVGEAEKLPIYIDDTSGLTHWDMRAKARRLKAEHDIGMVIVDYLQLMQGVGSVNRVQEISDISAGLKRMARELNVPVLALSQLNRAIEKRDDKHPLLSDLRESGSIEQDADLVLFIYREEVYTKNTEKHKGEADIIVAKQRNGPTGKARLAFVSAYASFEELSDRYDFDREPEPVKRKGGMKVQDDGKRPGTQFAAQTIKATEAAVTPSAVDLTEDAPPFESAGERPGGTQSEPQTRPLTPEVEKKPHVETADVVMAGEVFEAEDSEDMVIWNMLPPDDVNLEEERDLDRPPVPEEPPPWFDEEEVDTENIWLVNEEI